MLIAFGTSTMLILACFGFVAFAWISAYRLANEREQPRIRHWLLPWSLKGLVVPLAIWAAMNFGFSFELRPFLSQVQAAQNAGRWLPAYLHYTSLGLFVIGTYWTALTLGWIA